MYLVLPGILIGCIVLGLWPGAVLLIAILVVTPIVRGIYRVLCYFFDEVIKWK